MDEQEKEIEEMRNYLEKILSIDEKVSESRNTIMAYEGNASKHYYNTLSYLIPEPYKFEGSFSSKIFTKSSSKSSILGKTIFAFRYKSPLIPVFLFKTPNSFTLNF